MFMFISGLIVFSLKRKHMLLVLLSLEFIVVSLFFMMMLVMMLMTYEYFFSMIYLTFSVCEGVLGLAMLVLMIRTFGNDYILTFTLLW
uniref:NADH-ubiquinone oxidoreductase chain 4L n=1 Tax=Curculionoidea sp. 25 KM-2017 TaxID=2219409 RepID=A0A346RIB0_9CUCU|nr:NADH dehydrogenase subunit 4L [Curculionoidea sp. 25 KM-2017]